MFGKGITLFRLLGFEVRIDVTWLLLAFLIGWTLAVGLFPALYPTLSTASYLWMGIAGTLGIFASLIAHEFAHAMVARRHGLPIVGITLFLFGGVAEMNDEPQAPKEELQMAIAGPLASVAIAMISYLAFIAAVASAAPVQLAGVLVYLAWVNAILAVFNMVPAFPLDGGRVLRSLLWGWKGDLRWATRVASRIGSAFGILLIVLGVVSVVNGNLIGGLWWFLIGLFLRGAASASYGSTLAREALRGVPVRRVMKEDPVVVSPSMPVVALVEDFFYRHYYKMFPVVDGARLVGLITTGEVKALPREQWEGRTVADIMRPVGPETAVAPAEDAIAVLSKMNRSGQSRLLVAEGDRLVGVVTLKDMLSFLSLKLELEEDVAARAVRTMIGPAASGHHR